MTDGSLLGAAPTPDSLEGRTIRARLIQRLAPEAADAPTTLGRFELGRLLGQGSFGSVYEAHDPELGRTVALKVLRPLPNLAARLVEEARTMAAVSHPNVVEVYGADEENGRAYIVMECIQGRPLDEWLRAEAPALPDILAVFRQAAEGLGAA
ncbi:MAG: protein kinase, partial [Myxococcota bacterium]